MPKLYEWAALCQCVLLLLTFGLSCQIGYIHQLVDIGVGGGEYAGLCY